LIDFSIELPMLAASKALVPSFAFPLLGLIAPFAEAEVQAGSQPPMCGLQENSETSLSDALSFD
jgi:hypothetical protein